ncbi:MAG: NAD(+)/NADH kinase [Myxococcota bacterium]
MSERPSPCPRPVGVIANPVSGRDVRRLAARAASQTPESKRGQIQRAAVGAAAAGASRMLIVGDVFRVSQGAVEALRLPHFEFERLDVGRPTTTASDTVRATEAMREAGCGALVVLGGDGTNRAVARAWPDAPLVSISTGTNNVFPQLVEATTAGAAAGLVASGRVPLESVGRRAKRVEVRFPDGDGDFALVDVALLEGDHPGNLLPFDLSLLRDLVLARAEPAAVGMSPIGGLLHPSGFDDDHGVRVRCTAPGSGGTPLLVPASQGLYRTAHVRDARTLPLGEEVSIRGPGVLAFDGDRERVLAAGEEVRARVVRSGPCIIDVAATLDFAARHRLYENRPWHEDRSDTADLGCC